MSIFENILNFVPIHFGHNLYIFITFFALTLLSLVVVDKVLKTFLSRNKSKITNNIIKSLSKSFGRLNFLFYFCVAILIVNSNVESLIPVNIIKIFVAITLVFIARFLSYFIKCLVAYGLENKLGNKNISEQQLFHTLGIIPLLINCVVWLCCLIVYFNFLSFNISDLIATLGVSSIIIAFALQSVLQDLFASLTVFLDKPFEVGHYIKTTSGEGEVLKIGFKSTRIRTKTGEILVIPNKLLSDGRINNTTLIQERKVFNVVSIKSDVKKESLDLFIQNIKQFITSSNCMIIERISILKIDLGKINVEVVYTINNPDYLLYASETTTLNLFILENAEKLKVELYQGNVIDANATA